MAHLVLNHFCRWIEYADEIASNKCFHNKLPNNFENIPIILINHNEKDLIAFHIWNNQFPNIYIDHDKCPNFCSKSKLQIPQFNVYNKFFI
jgi:hypothetical protein